MFEVKKDLEDMTSTDEENLDSKAKIYSSSLSISFDVVMIMFFVWWQDENSEDAHENDDYEELCE